MARLKNKTVCNNTCVLFSSPLHEKLVLSLLYLSQVIVQYTAQKTSGKRQDLVFLLSMFRMLYFTIPPESKSRVVVVILFLFFYFFAQHVQNITLYDTYRIYINLPFLSRFFFFFFFNTG